MDQRTRAESTTIAQNTFLSKHCFGQKCGLIEILQCNPAKSCKLIIFMPNSKPYQNRGTIKILDPNGHCIASLFLFRMERTIPRLFQVSVSFRSSSMDLSKALDASSYWLPLTRTIPTFRQYLAVSSPGGIVHMTNTLISSIGPLAKYMLSSTKELADWTQAGF